jgi:tRNA pseudouridine32 synthase/23S rRNA pseudouridine746 synthase
MRAGVSPSCVVTTAGPWRTLLDFLAHRLPAVSHHDWAQRMQQGEVLDDQAQPLPPDTPHRPGLRLHYYRSLPHEAPIPFTESIVYQDDWLVVADKPHYLPVTPSGRYVQHSLLVRLKRRLGLASLSPIHRIDRETAGLVLFAVQASSRNAYHSLFRELRVHKTYEALAASPSAASATHTFPLTYCSHVQEDPQAFYRMCEVAAPPNSSTRISVLEQRGPLARYQLEPSTGRRHQLRVHMNALGLPLIGDQFYPKVLRGPDAAEDFQNPLRLLARRLRFIDPITQQERDFVSQLDLAWPAPTPPQP